MSRVADSQMSVNFGKLFSGRRKNQKVKRQYVTADTLTYPTAITHHVRASYIHRIRLSQPRPYSSPAIFGINVMSAGSQATESSWSAESQRAASCSRRCGLPPAIVQA